MRNIDIIVWTFFISAVFGVVFLVYSKRSKKNDLVNYDFDLRKLKKAIDINHKEGIVEYGNKVLWNYNLKTKDLNYLVSKIENYKNESLDFKKLYDSCIDIQIQRNTPNYKRFWVL